MDNHPSVQSVWSPSSIVSLGEIGRRGVCQMPLLVSDVIIYKDYHLSARCARPSSSLGQCVCVRLGTHGNDSISSRL